MIQTQLALIQRELWEHRSIYVTPAAIALIVCLMMITGQVSVSAMGEPLDFALLGAAALTENLRAAALTGLLTLISLPLLFSMLILTTFYSLDCLYAERKDRSILFWRSIPVTDSETVTSKLITALVVIPIVAFLLILITHLMVLLIASVWVSIRGADAWYLIWSAAPLLDSWMVTFITMLAMPLWLSPFISWFLFVSAFTKRSPFLTAFMPLILLPMIEKILLPSSYLATALANRFTKFPLFSFDVNDMPEPVRVAWESGDFLRIVKAIAESGLSLLSFVDLKAFFGSPGLWAGIIVCGLLTTTAIYLRRYRDET
jgi:ABC-2 type transport system permease protein